MTMKSALLGDYSRLAALAALGAVSLGAIRMDAPVLADLEARVVEINAALDAFRVRAEAGEDLTDEETAEIEESAGELEKLTKKIKALKLLQPTGQGRRSAPEARTEPAGGGQRRTVPAEPRQDNQRHGFRSFGSFAQSVLNHYRGNVTEEVGRLRNIATTYGGEGVGADGGFLIPPTFSQEIWQKVMAEENLLSRCTPLTTDGNSMMIPKDETTPWQTSGGVQVYWEGEAQVPSASKPLLELGNFRLCKLMGIVPISEEMMQDASGLESWLRAKAPSKMVAKINTAIIAGTGVGQPLGIIPGYGAVGASVVQVSKATSQPADTLWMANVEDMYSRMYSGWRRNGIWLINQDLEPQLNRMAFQAAGASSLLPGTNPVPAYMPAGGLSNSPYATLKGRPVVPLEACAAIGDLGDIIFADLSQYWALTKANGGVQTDSSIHLYFDQALTAFRFIFRVNGQPAWSSTIARQNGSNTLSWAVALQAR
ncbi:phage major capsid protein, HK97 family [Bradyrhizobium sp. YR681]|uniref:phage major capsid protein n=1 Tax=Bradyrhizobium sp. YR681 TaxID=1144344 RepID=UPI0002710D3D|nr:phage major capsid protein [Bradyrhizobium sp. YR681]EJN11841.1 phage major capsid protein, HK97 family [Bradyrhizobium sp. YR681]